MAISIGWMQLEEDLKGLIEPEKSVRRRRPRTGVKKWNSEALSFSIESSTGRLRWQDSPSPVLLERDMHENAGQPKQQGTQRSSPAGRAAAVPSGNSG